MAYVLEQLDPNIIDANGNIIGTGNFNKTLSDGTECRIAIYPRPEPPPPRDRVVTFFPKNLKFS